MFEDSGNHRRSYEPFSIWLVFLRVDDVFKTQQPIKLFVFSTFWISAMVCALRSWEVINLSVIQGKPFNRFSSTLAR